MKYFKFTIAFLFSVISAKSYSQQQYNKKDLNNFTWLLGKWRGDGERTIVIQSWEKYNDSSFNCMSVELSKSSGDTLYKEWISIYLAKDGRIFQSVSMEGVCVGQPSNKELVELKKGLAVFKEENSTLTYTDNKHGKRKTTIGSIAGGSTKIFEFRFLRIK